MKILPLLLIVVLLTSCYMERQPYQTEGEVYIVAVGLDYTNSNVTSLSGTINDVYEFSLCLNEIYSIKEIPVTTYLMVQEGYEVNTDYFLYPSDENVAKLLEALNPDSLDLIVFYFTGHGDVDSDGAFIATAKTGNDNEYTKLYLKDLMSVLEKKECPVAVLIDSCFSGYLNFEGKTEQNFKDAVKDIFSNEKSFNVSAISSSDYNQTSMISTLFTEEGLIENHSLFTASVLDGLGWVHSRLDRTQFASHTVCGYLKEAPSNLSMDDLYDRVLSDWVVMSQTPVINRTDVSVKIIP